MTLNFGKSTEILYQIIASQRSPHIRTNIGFIELQKGKVVDQTLKLVGENLKENGSRSSKS